MGRRQSMRLVESDMYSENTKPIPHSKQKYPQPVKTEGMWFKSKFIPRTAGQQYYVDCLRESTITICKGPAGCGKTWLVTRIALEMLLDNKVSRIVVTKPITPACNLEELGFLPGSELEKITPYMVNIMEAFEDHIGVAMVNKLVESGKISFMPISMARGRNLSNSFIIADEAQNLTHKGFKLFMTRIAEGSYMAINGDSDQIDIDEKESGLDDTIQSLRGKSAEISVVELDDRDIQRHPIIRVILDNLK